MLSKGSFYERKVYNLNDVLSYMGGLSGSLMPMFAILVRIFGST